MVEEDPRRGVEVVALPVVDGDPVAVDLGHAVRAARVERRRLALGNLLHLAEHLRGAGLVEADVGVDEANRIEHAGDPEGGRLAGEHRLAEAGLDERLRRQVVDLGGPVVPQDVDERDLVEQVARHQLQPVLNVGDALEVDRARPADHADDLVALLEEEFGQVRAILPGHACDQCSLRHWGPTLADRAGARRGAGRPGRPYSAASVPTCRPPPRLVPPRRQRRRVDRGGEMGRRAAAAGLDVSSRWPARARSTPSLQGLAIDATAPPTPASSVDALAPADLVVVENLCSLPLNPPAAAAGGRGLRRTAGRAAPSRPAVAAAASGPPAATARRPVLGPCHHQRAEPPRAGRRTASPPRRSTTPSTRPGYGPTGSGPGARSASARRRPAAPAADPCAGPQEHRGRPGPGRRGRRHVLAPRTGRGRLRPRARPPGGRRPVPGAARARGAAAAARRAIADAYAACDAVLLPSHGRASATPPSSRPPTAARWPSGPIRWRRSWPPSASAGSTAPCPARSPMAGRPRRRAAGPQPQIAATYFNLADLPGTPGRCSTAPPAGSPLRSTEIEWGDRPWNRSRV